MICRNAVGHDRRGAVDAPGSAVFKAAVCQQIADGVLHFGRKGELIALAAAAFVRGVPGILGPALIVLNRHRIAPVVELADDGSIVLYIMDGGLVVGVGEGQVAALDRAVILRNGADSAGLPGLADIVVSIHQLIAVHIHCLCQKAVCVIAVADAFVIPVGHGGKGAGGVAVGHIGDLLCAAALIGNAGDEAVRKGEGIYSSRAVGDGIDLHTVRGGIGNGNGALGRLIIFDPAQAALFVKVAGVILGVCYFEFGGSCSGGGQGQLHTVLVGVFSCRACCLKVVLGAVGILPDIVGGVLRPLVDLLVKVGAPAAAHAEGIHTRVIGVISEADGHGHPVAPEAQVCSGPYQVAGIVVHIAAAGTARGGAGEIPVAFQAVIIAEVDLQGGPVHDTVVGGIELHEAGAGALGLHRVGCLEHHACIHTGLVPLPDDVRHIPGPLLDILADHYILNGLIIVRLVGPGHGLRRPYLIHLMDLHRHIGGPVIHLPHGDGGAHHHIGGGQGGDIIILQVRAGDTVGGAVACPQDTACVADGPGAGYRRVPDIGGQGAGLDHRVQDHRPLALGGREPFPGQDIAQGVGPGAAGKAHLDIRAHLHGVVHQVRGGHDHDHILPAHIIEADTAVLIQHRDHGAGIKGIAEAPEGAVVPGHDHRLLDLIGGQVIDHGDIIMDIGVAHPGGEAIQHRLRMLGLGLELRDIHILILGCGGAGLFRSICDCAVGRQKRTAGAAGGQSLGHTEGEGIAVLCNGD